MFYQSSVFICYSYLIDQNLPEGNVLFLWAGVAKVRGGPLFGVALVLTGVSFMLLSLLIIMVKLDIQGNYL